VCSSDLPAVVRVAVIREIDIEDTGDVLARRGDDSEKLDFDAIHPWLREDQENPGEPDEPDEPAEAGEENDPRSFEVEETGSGFVFDAANGYILTNYHVISDAARIEVFLPDGRRHEARAVGVDPATDLAVLAVPAERLHQLAFGDSAALAVGDEVFAIGNPFGLDGTFSRGIVSALGRSTRIRDVPYQGFIQTDAVINPGNSGGPLVNLRGEVVGVNTAIATDTGRFDGVGFAIPSARVVALLPQILSGKQVVRGFLGVGTVDVHDNREQADALGWAEAYGVIVTNVWPDSPAADAGIRERDILLQVGDHEIGNGIDLMDTVALLAPDTESTITYWRDGQRHTVKVRITSRPDGV